jgi:hypothetical protein
MRVEAEGEASSSGPYASTGRGTFTGEDLLGPDDLPFGLTSLVVLQADLVDDPPRPLRRLRTGMFGLAREFGDTGVAVLVVPPLPDDLAARVVSKVAEASSVFEFTPVRVLDLFHEIRSMVAARETELSEDGERPSLDVVLIV